MFMQSREAVRVKVKKYEGKLPPEQQKFSVDPQITSLEVLQSILAKAFNLKGNFSLSYKSTNDLGQEDYLGLFSDWDLDAAFLRAQNACSVQNIEPCVHLIVDVKQPNEHSVEIENGEINPPFGKQQSKDNSDSATIAPQQQDGAEPKQQSGLHGKFLNQMEKTLNMVTRALNLSEDQNLPPRPPLSDAEFRSFLDPVGQVVQSAKLREVIYCGGIDPSLRRVVWKHILNVYPDGMSGKERMDYMKNKSAEYFSLRDVWRDCLHRGQVSNDLSYVTNMVKKDVLRTDRHHRFYAGSDDNQNIASLFNILTTYALNHPVVSYCQGMSDLASPLLVTMGDEAQAYICLCALMTRLYPNFLLDGEAMTLKFTHLTESLQVYDPQFYTYLKSQQADDLLFCYRWLLLEMKREFAFEDSLRMLEVLWSSLPYSPPIEELPLKENKFSQNYISEEFDEPPISPLVKTPRENAYTKLCAIRRQSSSVSLISNTKAKIVTYKRMNHSLDENIGKKSLNINPLMISKEFQSLDDADLPVHNKMVEMINSENSPDLKINFPYGADRELLSSSSRKSPGDTINENLKPIRSPIFMHQKYKIRDGVQRFSSTNKFKMSFEKLDIQTEDNENTTKKVIKSLSEFKKFSSSFNKPNDAKATTPEKFSVSRSDRETLSTSNSTGILSDNTVQEGVSSLSSDRKGCDATPKEFNDDDSSPDDSKDYSPMTTSMTTELHLELEHLDRRVLGTMCTTQDEPKITSDGNEENEESGTNHDFEKKKVSDKKETSVNKFSTSNGTISDLRLLNSTNSKLIQTKDSINDNVFIWENPLHGNGPAILVDKNKCDIQSNAEKNSTEEILKLKLICELDKNIDKKSISRTDIQSSSEIEKDVDKPDAVCDLESNPRFKNITRDMIKPNSKFFSNMSQELENARKSCEILLANKRSANLHSIAATITNFQKKCEFQNQTPLNTNEHVSGLTNHCEEVSESNYAKQLPALLPPPHLFGGGNPFLMFLCLTVLMQHRDFIMRNQMDYNELAMHFDKMVRKHDVNRVLNQARRMYSDYLKHQNDIHNVKM